MPKGPLENSSALLEHGPAGKDSTSHTSGFVPVSQPHQCDDWSMQCCAPCNEAQHQNIAPTNNRQTMANHGKPVYSFKWHDHYIDVQWVAVLLHEFLGDCATKVWKKDGRNGLKQSPRIAQVWGNSSGYVKMLKCRGSDTPRAARHVQTTDFE